MSLSRGQVQGRFERFRRSADTDCDAQMMRRAYNAKKLSGGESFKEECRKEGKLSEWTFERIREACEKVAMDDIGRLGTAQEIPRKSTDFSRRISAPVDGMGGVTSSYVCPHCNGFPLDDYIWWVSTGHGDSNNRKKHCNWWCAVEAKMKGERPAGYRWCTSVSTPMKRRCSERTQRRWGCV